MKVLGYEVNEDYQLIGAPCACNECRDGQANKLDRPYGQGHHNCSSIPDELLSAERAKRIFAQYDRNAWRWFVR